MKVSKLIKMLQKDYKPNDTVAYSLWDKDDVRRVIDSIDDKFKVTDEECYAILEIFLDNQRGDEGLIYDNLYEEVCDFMQGNPRDPIAELMDTAKRTKRRKKEQTA